MRISLLLILLLLLCSCRDDQLQKIDSYSVWYSKAVDSTRSYDDRLKYTTLAEKHLSRNDTLFYNRLFQIVDLYDELGSHNDYLRSCRNALQSARLNNDSLSIAKASIYLGNYYNNFFIDDSAYYYFFKAEKIAIKLSNQNLIVASKLRKGQIQYNYGDYFGAESSAINVLKLIDSNSSSKYNILGAYNLLGNVYCDLHDFEPAVFYHKKALELSSNGSDLSLRSYIEISKFNLGLVYQESGKYVAAKNLYLSALDRQDIYKTNPSLYANILGNLGYCGFKIDGNTPTNLIYKSLAINDSLKFRQRIIINNLQLSEYYMSTNQLLKAYKFAERAHNLSKYEPDLRNQLISLKQLIRSDPRNASLYSEQYIKISDSLQIEERKIRNKFARIEFETDELIIEKDKAIKEKKFFLSSSVVMILFLSLSILLLWQKIRQKELNFAKNQQITNEEIYRLLLVQQSKVHEGRQMEKKRISRDLHDGIMNRLSGARINLHSLTSNNDNESVKNCIPYITELQKIEEEVRNISHDLNKDIILGHDSYKKLIEVLFDQQKAAANAVIHLEMDPSIQWEKIDNVHKVNIYRILQECLQNSNNHSKANNIFVTFRTEDQQLMVDISDDGIGFNTKRTRNGIGLKNITSRAKLLGGILEITSSKGNGVKIKLLIPI